MDVSCSTIITNPDGSIKLYKYRWIIIATFAIYCTINFAQFVQFTIIADIVQKYYQVDLSMVNLSGVLFMILNILLFAPTGYIVEKTSLKTSTILCVGLTALANCLKLFAAARDRYYVVLITQSLCAVAQNFMLVLPSKVACSWFGAEEVSFACSIGIFGTQIGTALGSIVTTQVVRDHDDINMITDDLYTLFIYNAGVSVIVLIIVIIFFRSKPPSPPSQSQVDLSLTNKGNEMTYWSALKGFAKNKDFIIVLCTMGLAYGQWNYFLVMVSPMMSQSFPDEDNTLSGILSSVATIAGGCFGTVIFGYLLDRTHKFKSISFLVLLANLVSLIAVVCALLMSNKIATCIAIPIYGFFSDSLMVIVYEYTVETTYPTPEAFGAAILNVVIYIYAIIFIQGLTIIFDQASYLVGYIIMLVIVAIATFPIFFVSSELKRRNANIKS